MLRSQLPILRSCQGNRSLFRVRFLSAGPGCVTQSGIPGTEGADAQGSSSNICTKSDEDCLQKGKRPDLCPKAQAPRVT